jgi:hypothetical protein
VTPRLMLIVLTHSTPSQLSTGGGGGDPLQLSGMQNRMERIALQAPFVADNGGGACG